MLRQEAPQGGYLRLAADKARTFRGQVVRCRGGPAREPDLVEWQREAIASARDRCDRAHAERLTHNRNLDREIVLFHRKARPPHTHEFVLSDHALAPLD